MIRLLACLALRLPSSAATIPFAEVSVPNDTMVVSEEVTFSAGGRMIPGTLTHPRAGTGPTAALLLMAGSGPTDRDWNSPLLPGKNGSARQLAEALAGQGLVVLRFDKAFSGKNSGPPLAELTSTPTSPRPGPRWRSSRAVLRSIGIGSSSPDTARAAST